jgi:hypothetical protein
MSLARSIALLLSGALIAGSVALSWIGYTRSALSHRAAVVFTSVGVGIGGGMFLYYGISNGDFVGSTIIGLFGGIIAGATTSATLRRSS